MNVEQRHFHTHLLQPSRRLVDATVPFFEDYGYGSAGRAIRAIDESLCQNRKPHLILVVGESKNGKQHLLLDIMARLYQRHPAPLDVVYWGNSFSVAKVKGKIPYEKEYGQFEGQNINLVTNEYEDLVFQALQERQKSAAIVAVKGVVITGAFIEGELHGSNRGLTAAENFIKRQGRFAELDYRAYVFGLVADPEAVMHGNETRTASEAVVDNPAELVSTQQKAGEIVLTGQREGEKLTAEQQKVVVEYVLESANTTASEEIISHVNSLAIKLSQSCLLKLNRESYQLNEERYYFDEKAQVWRFFDPMTRMLAVALVMRYVLEENLDLKNKVFLGKTHRIEERVLDLRAPIRNVARVLYPAIDLVRNK